MRNLLIILLMFTAGLLSGQRDSVWVDKIKTYQPIDTAEIDRDVEYEVVLKHFSTAEGGVIRRDTVAGYAADYLRGLIAQAQSDSINLASFLEVHYANYKQANTDYLSTINLLAALRSVTGGGAIPQNRVESSGGEYIGRILTPSAGNTNPTDSLIIGATYLLTAYDTRDDFSNVGSLNYNNNVFVATGRTPAVWTHGSILYYASRDTVLYDGNLDIGKMYSIGVTDDDDFTNLYKVSDSIIYHFLPDITGDVSTMYIANEQPTSWEDGSAAYDYNIDPIVYKNTIGINVGFFRYNSYKYFVYCDLPVFNTTNYYVEISDRGSGAQCQLLPINNHFAVIYQQNESEIYELYLKITKL